MTPKVTIIDFGSGNILSVTRAFEYCGATVSVATKAGEISLADHVVLPGVGSFGDAVSRLHSNGMFEATKNFAASGKPLLGICLGMQLLMEESEEAGHHEGLGIVNGKVLSIPNSHMNGRKLKIPHIGWDVLSMPRNDGWNGTLLDRLPENPTMYFVHSFAVTPENPDTILATTNHGDLKICAAIHLNNVYGLQGHPEKSGAVGLSILKNFLEL